MIRHLVCTGRTCSTSSIQREVIQAQGHTGSNQNCTVSRSAGCAVMIAATLRPGRPFPPGRAGEKSPAYPPAPAAPGLSRAIRARQRTVPADDTVLTPAACHCCPRSHRHMRSGRPLGRKDCERDESAGHPHRPRGRLPDRRGVMFLYHEAASLVRLRPTLRAQLTLLYGGLLAALAGGLLVLLVPLRGSASVEAWPHAAAISAALNASIRQKEIIGAIALPVVVLLALAGGRLIAGRFLRPLRTITATARDISASNLNRRLSVTRRDAEFAELGETLNDLFGRLEASLESQRHFVANASHELRTPLTAERALLQVALADPDASAQTLRSACEQVLALGDQQERLIEALLTLASSEGGIEQWEPFDLAAVAWHVVTIRREEAARRGVHVENRLAEAPTAGDPRLV